jgi:hypothetical protein
MRERGTVGRIFFTHHALRITFTTFPFYVSPFTLYAPAMFSHVVIFWTDPANPRAADELIAGAERYLKPIPGVLHFHIGRMAPSARPVVDQTYQVALNITFPSKKAQDDYQVHPLHVDFVEKVFKPACKRVVVYDFE